MVPVRPRVVVWLSVWLAAASVVVAEAAADAKAEAKPEAKAEAKAIYPSPCYPDAIYKTHYITKVQQVRARACQVTLGHLMGFQGFNISL